MYILLSEYEKSDILSWLFPPAKPKDEMDASATDSNMSKKVRASKINAPCLHAPLLGQQRKTMPCCCRDGSCDDRIVRE
jgi:hypothetical protein